MSTFLLQKSAILILLPSSSIRSMRRSAPQDSKHQDMGGGEHFVLVHGAGHGAWCWFRLVPLLKSLGQRVTALDLGSSGIDPKRLDELRSVHDYVQPVMDFVASLPQGQKVVLVGHSYGGLALSLVMESFPEKIRVAVFISAYMPNHVSPPITQVQEFFKKQCNPESLRDCQISFGQGLESLPTAVLFGPDYLSTTLYQCCRPEDIELAKSLIRPHRFLLKDFAKESLLSKEKYGSVDRVYVMLEKDEIMKEEFQRWVIDDSPPKAVKFIAGADHMVMLSKPRELCTCLQEILLLAAGKKYQDQGQDIKKSISHG